MPLFDYECKEECAEVIKGMFGRTVLEILVSKYDEIVPCPNCGEPMHKLPAIPNVYIPGIPVGMNERYH